MTEHTIVAREALLLTHDEMPFEAADADVEATWLYHVFHADVIEAEILIGDAEGYGAGFVGFQGDSLEVL